MGPHFKTLSKQSSGKYIKSEFLLSLHRHWYSAENDSKYEYLLKTYHAMKLEALLTKSKTHKKNPLQYDVK